MLKINDQEYERIKELKYLGTISTEVPTAIKQQIIMANKATYGLKKQLKSLKLK
jgi:hypothetical protein